MSQQNYLTGKIKVDPIWQQIYDNNDYPVYGRTQVTVTWGKLFQLGSSKIKSSQLKFAIPDLCYIICCWYLEFFLAW